MPATDDFDQEGANQSAHGEALPESSEPTTWQRFLADVPQAQERAISEAVLEREPRQSKSFQLQNTLPTPIDLPCGSEDCLNGIRKFDRRPSNEGAPSHVIATYRCRNCHETHKTYFILLKRALPDSPAIVEKIGEWPPFGSELPSRLISLIGPDRDLFLKGRRAENQGLGIAAFAYYRRVVERQKNRFIDEMLKVAVRVGSDPEVVNLLQRAREEGQFSRAVDSIKDAIPPILRIDGHSPLTLLHKALSRGLHNSDDDQECLEMARDIRLVLLALVDRVETALKDETHLHQAVARLTKVQPPKS